MMRTEENIIKNQQLSSANDVEVDEVEEVEETGIVALPFKIQRFINLYMTGQYTLVKLAELLDVHPNTVHKWLRRGDVKEVISDMQRSTQEVVGVQLKALQSKAVRRLNELLDSPIDGVAYQAVRDILDRGGHKPEQKINVNKTVVTYEEKLKNLIDNVSDMDNIIEGEFEVSDEE